MLDTNNGPPILEVSGLEKTFDSGFQALKRIDLTIPKGEIFALLGPNGAGKTTLISIICGITKLSAGTVSVDGHDIETSFREARSRIGLVPQELTTDKFEKVWDQVAFSRGLFGKKRDDEKVASILRELSLYEKRNDAIMNLSGGMKRRLLIAKALAHEPEVLFLDEPTAGVDVALRRDMWNTVSRLRDQGVTIILTTHYIEEAEMMADRIGVISKGELILVEDKTTLMQKLGHKELTLTLQEPIGSLPESLAGYDLSVSGDRTELTYSYDPRAERTGIATLISLLAEGGVSVRDVSTKQSTLEEIFVGLVGEK